MGNGEILFSEQRFGQASPVFCTLYKKGKWIPWFGKGAFTESIYGRFAAHDSIIIDIPALSFQIRHFSIRLCKAAAGTCIDELVRYIRDIDDK